MEGTYTDNEPVRNKCGELGCGGLVIQVPLPYFLQLYRGMVSCDVSLKLLLSYWFNCSLRIRKFLKNIFLSYLSYKSSA